MLKTYKHKSDIVLNKDVQVGWIDLRAQNGLKVIIISLYKCLRTRHANAMRKTVSQEHTIQLLAKYTHQVLALFDAGSYLCPCPTHWMDD